ncbi:MAG: hypothetical protein L3J24_14660 [Xanthomonadales bacterium]|nr:hypothetical protein [Xanthomonadales bacterium]
MPILKQECSEFVGSVFICIIIFVRNITSLLLLGLYSPESNFLISSTLSVLRLGWYLTLNTKCRTGANAGQAHFRDIPIFAMRENLKLPTIVWVDLLGFYHGGASSNITAPCNLYAIKHGSSAILK